MISSILIIAFALGAFIGVGALIMALAQIMAGEPDETEQPRGEFDLHDWRKLR
jgi:TRAP-type mannitol/chloroaromatic compound transport system permease small subunit